MLYDKDIREPLFDFLEEHYGKISRELFERDYTQIDQIIKEYKNR